MADAKKFSPIKVIAQGPSKKVKKVDAQGNAVLDAEGKEEFENVEGEIKEYLITIPQFIYNGELVVAEELAKNEKLLTELLEMKFGGLKPVS